MDPYSYLPTPFLATVGTPVMRWSMWYNTEFKVYATARGWQDWGTDRREALLLQCVGQEARRLYFASTACDVPSTVEVDTVTDVIDAVAAGEAGDVKTDDVKTEPKPDAKPDRISDVCAVFQRLFPETQDVHTERVLFRRCFQQTHQSVEVYAAELQSLSNRCDFGHMREQFVCEQLIEGCRSDKLREKLCCIDNLSLSKALEKARMLENVDQRKRLLAGHSAAGSRAKPVEASSPPVQVAAVKSKQPQHAFKKQPRQQHQGQQHQQQQRPQNQVACYNCGGPHMAKDPTCPARGRSCRNCGISGHFSKCCKRKTVHAVQVMSVGSDASKLWTNVMINGKLVKMLVDTGSAVSIMPRKLYQRMFRDLTLNPSATRLEAYGGNELQVYGVLHVQVGAESSTTCDASVYVVEADTPLLGRDLQVALQVSIRYGTTVCAVDPDPEEVGKLPAIRGFRHRVIVDPDVQPVQQRLRPLPFSLREEVKEHLEELQEQGVIRRVDSSPWLSNLVITRKRTGKLRVVLDLRDANKAVKVSGHPLPAMQDMFDNLRGATVFSCLTSHQPITSWSWTKSQGN